MYTGYEKLANEIILQAVEDYRKSRNELKSHPRNQEVRVMQNDCKRFFLSGWFQVLTELDGEDLLSKLKAEN